MKTPQLGFTLFDAFVSPLIVVLLIVGEWELAGAAFLVLVVSVFFFNRRALYALWKQNRGE